MLSQSRLSIRVEKVKLVKSVHLESEGSLVTIVLLSEVLEDLLKRGLLDTILLNVHVLLLLLDGSEEETNSFVLSWQTKLEEVTALLKKLHLFKHAAHGSDELETIGLSIAELHKG